MSKTSIALGALLVIVLGGGYWWHAEFGTPYRSQPRMSQTASSTIEDSMSFTSTEVAAHDSAQSCYTSINGNVYDLTDWVSQHPGGPYRILSICGTDGTQAFETQHSGQADPNAELAMFKIGVLAK